MGIVHIKDDHHRRESKGNKMQHEIWSKTCDYFVNRTKQFPTIYSQRNIREGAARTEVRVCQLPSVCSLGIQMTKA